MESLWNCRRILSAGSEAMYCQKKKSTEYASNIYYKELGDIVNKKNLSSFRKRSEAIFVYKREMVEGGVGERWEGFMKD